MQNFVTLSAFFLVEKKGLGEKERKKKILFMPMGVLALVSAHGRPSAQRGFF